jgi:hypothetical protein
VLTKILFYAGYANYEPALSGALAARRKNMLASLDILRGRGGGGAGGKGFGGFADSSSDDELARLTASTAIRSRHGNAVAFAPAPIGVVVPLGGGAGSAKGVLDMERLDGGGMKKSRYGTGGGGSGGGGGGAMGPRAVVGAPSSTYGTYGLAASMVRQPGAPGAPGGVKRVRFAAADDVSPSE